MLRHFVNLIILILLIGAATVAQAQSAAEIHVIQTQVESVLRAQQDAWNHHDLRLFMSGYWNSPELTFFSGAKEHDGWQATLDRYISAYSGPGHEMGNLDFSNLRIEALGREAAFVRGAWKLTLSDGKTPHGLFTLVFRKVPEGWKIVHDHTSAE